MNKCNDCKLYSTKPHRKCQVFRTGGDRPFEVMGVDFAGPLHYKLSKKEDRKRNVLIFTCAASRTVHLEVTKDQTAEGFSERQRRCYTGCTCRFVSQWSKNWRSLTINESKETPRSKQSRGYGYRYKVERPIEL